MFCFPMSTCPVKFSSPQPVPTYASKVTKQKPLWAAHPAPSLPWWLQTSFKIDFFFFFGCGPIFKLYWICYILLLPCFIFVLCFGCEAREILVPQAGIEPESPALEGEILTTWPPGKSPEKYVFSSTWKLMQAKGLLKNFWLVISFRILSIKLHFNISGQ